MPGKSGSGDDAGVTDEAREGEDCEDRKPEDACRRRTIGAPRTIYADQRVDNFSMPSVLWMLLVDGDERRLSVDAVSLTLCELGTELYGENAGGGY